MGRAKGAKGVRFTS